METRTVNGNKVAFYTISELAKMSGRSKYSIFKLEERGIIPNSNYRTTPNFITKRVPSLSLDKYNEYKVLFHKVTTGEPYNASVLDEAIKVGQIMEGYRLYSEYIVEKLTDLLKKIRRGVEVSHQLKTDLIDVFKEEESIINNL